MNKEKYFAPEIEIVEFDAEDIITTSNKESDETGFIPK